MKLRNFFEKKRNIFFVGFIGAYLLTMVAFLIINFVAVSPPANTSFTQEPTDESLTIEEKTLYEDNDVVVRQIDFNNNPATGIELTLEIINNSDTTYYVADKRLAVNKIMTASTSIGQKELLPNTTTLLYVPVSMQENNLLDVTKIGEMVFDLEFYTEIGSVTEGPTIGFIAEDLRVETNHYKELPKLTDIDGTLVYGEDNILVTVDEESLFVDNAAQVSIQNNNDKDIVFTAVNFTVDGKKIDGFCEIFVRANSRTITSGLQLSYPEDISKANLSVKSIAGVYGEGSETLFSKPYNMVWK